MTKAQLQKYLPVFVAGCFLGLTLFLSFYRLTVSPPTWFDEGMITQAAMHQLGGSPRVAIEVAPQTFVPGWFVTSGYTVLLPVAASLWLLGTSLFAARLVMALFIVGFVVAAYMLARKEMPVWLSVASLALVATFAPLYGNGKNVLGEVPGLFFTALFLLSVIHIERRQTSPWFFLLTGMLLGLAVSTKPIFLLLLPAAGLVLLFSRRLLTVSKVLLALFGFFVCTAFWILTQYRGASAHEVLSIYLNPNAVSQASSFMANIRLFILQPEPLYAFLLLGVWAVSCAIRLYCRRPISRAESIALLFSFLVYVAYLRTQGFYRYFFVGEMLALIYLPLAAWEAGALFEKINLKRSSRVFACALLVLALTLFQSYQVFFNSWVADHYNSTRSASLLYLERLPANKTIFLYNTPEAAVFLPKNMQYYQYLDITKTVQVGTDQIQKISKGVPDYVLLGAGTSGVDLSRYALISASDYYALWGKTATSTS